MLFCVLRVRETGRDVDLAGDVAVHYVFEVATIKAQDVPAGAVVHEWKWDKRERKARVWR